MIQIMHNESIYNTPYGPKGSREGMCPKRGYKHWAYKVLSQKSGSAVSGRGWRVKKKSRGLLLLLMQL